MRQIIYSEQLLKKVADRDPALLIHIHKNLEAQPERLFTSSRTWLRFITPFFPKRNYRVLCKAGPDKSTVNVFDIIVEAAYNYIP